MFEDMQGEVLATVAASQGRRVAGIGALVILGLLVIYVGFSNPPAIGWQAFLLVVGGGSLWIANRMRLATANVIELTETELRDSSGEVIAKVADIVSIDRGFFAFKPSNGFLVRTKTPGPRIWRPGLWWRIGRQIGVGGMTPGHQSKFMSEILATMLAQRDMS